jgi:pyruvate dehydrogenase E2 component (dihydrolipoamide acetyltransferase)
MPSEFRLPALGADMDDGTLVEWHVAPGDRVKRGDVVAVVETDKGAIDVEIFLDGIVKQILVSPGTRIPVGAVLALVETDVAAVTATGAGTDTAAPISAPAATPAPAAVVPPIQTDRPRISPAARRRAQELGVDAASLQGTGPGGSITTADVERAQPTVEPSQRPAPAAVAEGAEKAERSGMRAAIAEAMSRSKREIPHYYLSTTSDVTPAVTWLASHNASVPVAQRLLFAALLVKAVALACRTHKGFSGFYRGGGYEESAAVHVGVAVALRGGGLVAPAIMDTADKTLAAVMEDLRALVTRARAGRLRASELAAPTIILTSLGDAAVDAVFPIIQPPQVAIIGAGAVAERPWVVAGSVVPRQVLTLSLGADHRVTDGRLGAQFLAGIAAKLADPASL